MYICSVKKIMNRHDYRIDFNVQSKAMLSIWRKNEVFFEAFTFIKLCNMEKLLTILMLLLLSVRLSAQQINGKVVDEKGEPLAFVNVVLLSRQDSSLVKGTMTREDGTFTIEPSGVEVS